MLGHNGGAPEEKGAPVSKRYDELPNDVEKLEKTQSDLKAQIRKLQLEIDVRQATLEILKKDPGTDPKRLTNAEKAAIISSLLGAYPNSRRASTPRGIATEAAIIAGPGGFRYAMITAS